MLLNLHVKNLAIIDEVEVDFSQQLNVMTGETGAGKSIIIGSINIALGGKISGDMIRKGADYALVELIFSVDSPIIHQALEELGIKIEDDEVLISRRLTGSRSINRINGENVTLATIRKVAAHLIDIHGQNDQQSLLHSSTHCEIVDRYAREDLEKYLEQMNQGYHQYQELIAQREQGQIPEEERLREISFMQYELDEIEKVDMKPGEEEELAEQYRRLSNATNIAQGLGEVYEMSSQGMPSISEQLGRSLQILHRLCEYDNEVADFALQLSQIDELMTDFNRDVSGYMDGFDTGSEQLVEVERRLDQIRMIQAKYGNSVEEIQKYAMVLQEKLDRYQEYEAFRGELDQKILAQEELLTKLGQRITRIRKQHSKHLEQEITKALIDLNFLQVQFQIQVRPRDHFTSHGADEVEFMISTNPGVDIKPIGQAASGGELSRIMLAIKAVLAKHDQIPTLIFDEIDVGISGRTAQMVAEKMAYIGATHQVICISHLAQIAAMADAHYLIEKQNDNKHTATEIVRLSQTDAVGELARILGGVEITEAVNQSAMEMHQLAQSAKTKIRQLS